MGGLAAFGRGSEWADPSVTPQYKSFEGPPILLGHHTKGSGRKIPADETGPPLSWAWRQGANPGDSEPGQLGSASRVDRPGA